MKNWNAKTNLFFLFLSFLLICTSCSTFFSSEEDGANQQKKRLMEIRIIEAENQFEEQNFSEALDFFISFKKDFPNSPFEQQADLGQARSLTALKKWKESLTILKKISEVAISNKDTQTLGLAGYYSSLNYEALGDEDKTLACLKDAEKSSNLLPIEIARGELPARFAVYYNRHHNHDEAQKYYHLAEQGIAVLLQKNKELYAKNFFQMGFVSTSQATAENLPSVLSTLELMQIFTLRSIEMRNKNWSTKALQNLKSNYLDIWNAIIDIPMKSKLDPAAGEHQRSETQFKSIGQMLEVIQKLRSFQRAQYEKNPFERDLFAFLDELEEKAQKKMESISGSNKLTKEALVRRLPKKKGRTLSEPFFPVEMADPNIKGNSQ